MENAILKKVALKNACSMPATGVPIDLNEKCDKLDQETVAQKVM